MYNTGNPVPSTALEDMADNAQVFDALVTKTEGTTTDRLGRTRRVFQQILMDMGFQPLAGSFQTGATITARNQTLYDEASKVFYAWGGALPKVVAAGSTPATAGGTGVGAWSDKTDLMLRSELSGSGGASLIKKYDGETLEYALGTRFRPLTNSADAINAAAQLAIASNGALDLTGVSQWNINKTLVLTNVPVILASFMSPIIADVTGTYTNGYAVEIGDPSVSWDLGRAVGTSVLGSLRVDASSRASALNGVYLKGSWLNIGHIRCSNFNGMGIHGDSVWDSTMDRIAVELCGNISTYAINLSSNGDTFNATQINSVQCEQAYQKAIKIDAIRCVIQNIHAERLYQLSSNDGATGHPDSSTWRNTEILLSNSILKQAVFDSATVNAPTGEIIIPGQTYRALINGDKSTVDSCLIAGSLMQTYGSNMTFTAISASDLLLAQPAKHTTILNSNVVTFKSSSQCNVYGGSIYNLRAYYNAYAQVYSGVDIDNVLFDQSFLGDIVFSACRLRSIGDLLSKSSASKADTAFINCYINSCTSAWNSVADFNNCFINSANLASQSKFRFSDTKFGVFNFTGNSGFITRNCTADTVTAWTYPQHVNYPAGTLTERVGYNASGKIYENTNGATSWAKIA